MRTILMACCWLMLFSVNCCAQLSVNPEWRERTGLTVGSAQTVFVSANVLRGFVTLESIDREPRSAIANIASQKKAAIEALKAIGVSETSIKITSTQMLEFQETSKAFRTNKSDSNALFRPRTRKSTRRSHICVSIFLSQGKALMNLRCFLTMYAKA